MALCKDRDHVVIADTNIEKQEQLSERTANREYGAKTLAVETNVTCEKSVKELFEKTVGEFGVIDILVNSTGICRMIPILDIQADEWDRIMAVNLRGTFLTCREAFALIKERVRGCIINIASVAGKTGGAVAGAHYSASRGGGGICFTKSLTQQAAPFRIRVSAVAPGPTTTELTADWDEEINKKFAEAIPWKEYATPEDVANAVVFLASSEARYITGEILDVNGGLLMN